MPVLVAHAKLTLSLRVEGRRADGYHLLDAEMVSLELADTLSLEEVDGDEQPPVLVEGAPGLDATDNLVTSALRKVGRRATVRLVKRIPPGAGLGGGSSDAAAVLRWAGVADLDLAAQLGADVPFCLVGGRARVRGIGEQVEPMAHRPQVFTLLTPPFGCSTAAVFQAWDELGGPRGEAGNDLEPAALAVEPRLARYRDVLAEASGERPRLAGSGSTWFVEGAHPGDGLVVTRTVAGTPQPL